MFPQNENWNEGTFGCSPRRKPERGYVRQNHPFTKPPFRKRQFVHKMFVHNFCANYPPPLPTSKVDGFPLEFLLKGPQTELRTLSQNCAQTLQKLRTNRIMNKRAFLNKLVVATYSGGFRGSLGVLPRSGGQEVPLLSCMTSLKQTSLD